MTQEMAHPAHSQRVEAEVLELSAAMRPQSPEVLEGLDSHIALVAHLCTMQGVEVEVSKTSVKGAMWELAAMAAEVTVE
jgi:hypothetical protein